MNKNWYAVYTKKQCEKKVASQLSKKKIEAFCPLNRITNNYGDRRKMAYEPLFPLFVFVYVTEAEMAVVRQTGDVINFVYWIGKPAIFKTPEIENVAHFVGTYYNIKVEKIAVNSSGMVRISNEPRIDLNIGSISLKTTSIKLSLPSLGYAMSAVTEKSSIDEFDYGFENLKMLI